MKRHEAQRLIADTEKDLHAFNQAFDCIEQRIEERKTDGTLEEFADWPGTKAVTNVLIMVRVRCEGLIEDMRKNMEALPPELELVPMENDDDQRS